MAPGDPALNDRVRRAIEGELALADRLFASAGEPAGVGGAVPGVDPARLAREQAGLTGLRERARALAGGPVEVAADSTVAGAWAADRVAAALVALGHPDALVEIARAVAVRGRRLDGQDWRVAVAAPEAGKVALVLALRDASVATASASAPAAGGLAEVSVVHADGAWAGVLAATLLTLGPDRGRIEAARAGVAARFVVRTGKGAFAEWSTAAFDAWVPAAPAAPGRR
jgi:thiamine biosynthesis lipoprotein